MRHVDAGHDEAVERAKERGVDIPICRPFELAASYPGSARWTVVGAEGEEEPWPRAMLIAHVGEQADS